MERTKHRIENMIILNIERRYYYIIITKITTFYFL